MDYMNFHFISCSFFLSEIVENILIMVKESTLMIQYSFYFNDTNLFSENSEYVAEHVTSHLNN
jgi:hypothetical protein